MELKNQTRNLENINEQFYLCMYPIIMSQREYNWTVSSLPYLSAQLYYVPEGWIMVSNTGENPMTIGTIWHISGQRVSIINADVIVCHVCNLAVCCQYPTVTTC